MLDILVNVCYTTRTLKQKERTMRKLQYTTQLNRYYIGDTTSGATNDILITDGSTTLKLEDCLI